MTAYCLRKGCGRLQFVVNRGAGTGLNMIGRQKFRLSQPPCWRELIFAGEHTSEESPGYMNGGVDSGERAARQV